MSRHRSKLIRPTKPRTRAVDGGPNGAARRIRQLPHDRLATVVRAGQCRWVAAESNWSCRDCGIDTDAINEYYMVADPVWDQATTGMHGHLCVGCLERRLGRALHAGDFTDRPVNTTDQLRRSARLTARMHCRP